MRSLSPEEAELWGRVTASIKPLSRERDELQGVESEQLKSSPERGGGPPKVVEGPGARNRPLRQSLTRPPPPRSGEDLHRSTLDSGWDKRLASGSVEPDHVLDLHGMNLDSAWRAIDRALERSVNSGDRVLLLITGHHRPGAPPVERGRIRAAVHDWLAASRHARRIAAIRNAHRRHGGGGSLYIILRRPARR